MPDFNTILVANRGEIAVRIIGTARAQGYRTVAVYSDADEAAPHVRLADLAVRIGPAPVGESYLDGARLLDAASRSGSDALHPGYGFLSENDAFASACADAGLTFIGPPPEAIALMGNKRLAKERMAAAGLPCVPGYNGEDQSDAVLTAEAKKIGLPLMIKAAAGGGGRGMRLVEDFSELSGALASARSEAENAFGSGELILEKALPRPRHVEIQVFADSRGNALHLGERDCSVQRRHQKVIEEAPSPAVSPELRRAMGEAAVKAALEIGYIGAGTVEFLLDGEGKFHFLEMNTRLQVEHPVTELITGLDLVAWQLLVAAGDPLPLSQQDIRFRGHAIEARLYAEDPYNDFLPRTGRVLAWKPVEREGVRIDHGLQEGSVVSSFYDPMLAKVCAHGDTREEARRRLVAALEDTVLLGVDTNKAFLAEMLRHPAFREGEATTGFIPDHFPDDQRVKPMPEEAVQALAAVTLFGGPEGRASRWQIKPHPVALQVGWRETARQTAVKPISQGVFEVDLDDRKILLRIVSNREGRVRFECGDIRRTAFVAWEGKEALIEMAGVCERFREIPPQADARADFTGDGRVSAPMNGRIVAIRAGTGDKVEKGQCLIVLEAMKIEHELSASMDGIVESVAVREGEQVATRQLLMELGAIPQDG